MPGSTNQQTDHATHETAFKSVAAHLRFWSTAVLALAFDLWSKHWVFTNLEPREVRPFVSNFVVFRRSLNDGAVFGSFSGQTSLFVAASFLALGFVIYLFVNSPRRAAILQCALALIIAGALGNLYDRAFVKADIVKFTNRQGQQVSLIGLIVGDPAADTILVGSWPESANPQRFKQSEVHLRHQGVVRDFVKFVPRFPQWVPKLGGTDVWPWVFNVADAALVCGVVTLMLLSLFDRSPKSREEQDSET